MSTREVFSGDKFDKCERRRAEFTSEDDKCFYDAANLIRIAEEESIKQGTTVDPRNLIKRRDDDVAKLTKAMYLKLVLHRFIDPEADGRNPEK